MLGASDFSLPGFNVDCLSSPASYSRGNTFFSIWFCIAAVSVTSASWLEFAVVAAFLMSPIWCEEVISCAFCSSIILEFKYLELLQKGLIWN
ncbi:uncharacterized protein LOC129292981 isoform X2 [Prosopis cineraria]|uniref:uncharacterized protein LOC129292981 isoform X2 n=1 Tax=Prosopis cineraria TaxID=364024 RepID=UPI00240EBD2B|nr:uncharacterized protein LOC129292981 isoform X2 [Prosopis cineraria]